MRVIVCGSRAWTDGVTIRQRLAMLPRGSVVVHGTARGADEIAGRIAKTLGLKVEEHPAEWTRYGRRAGFIRNRAMATAGADLCIAFWTNGSTGTGHMLRIAREAGIPTEIHSL